MFEYNIKKHDVPSIVRQTMHECGLNPANSFLLVGFSGGADSTALLQVLYEFGYCLRAIHLHHGLRGAEADRDAEWCAELCKKKGMEFECHSLAVQEHQYAGENLEAAARRLRLEFWSRYLQQQDFTEITPVVMLGHHADDALEDLFLRLGRGSNASGVTGLRAMRKVQGVLFVRPLLHCRKQQIESFLRNRGITDWRKDKSNQDTTFRRNAVRHELLPLLRNIWGGDEGFLRSFEVLLQDAEYLEQSAADYVDFVSTADGFQKIPQALQPRALRLWIQRQKHIDTVPSLSSVERLRRETERKTSYSRKIPLGKGMVVTIEKDRLKLGEGVQTWPEISWNWAREPALVIEELALKLEASVVAVDELERKVTGTSDYECFNLQAMPNVLTVRPWQAGDRMTLFGHSTPVKVKRVFQAEKVPSSERLRVPLILAHNNIIWAAGIARGAKLPVDLNKDKKILMLTITDQAQTA